MSAEQALRLIQIMSELTESLWRAHEPEIMHVAADQALAEGALEDLREHDRDEGLF